MQLRVAHIIADTEAEGPGRRYALWVQGCSLRCPGCCNPEMFSADKGGHLRDVESLVSEIAATPEIEGVSILGGEPFEQAPALAAMCEKVKGLGLSVMVYSGYTLSELKEKRTPVVDALLSQIDLLVDGRYLQTQPEMRRRWIGSSNQAMHFLSARYSPQDSRFTERNSVELRLVNGQLTINGWPQAADAFRSS